MSYADTAGSTDNSTTSSATETYSFLSIRDSSITNHKTRPHPPQGINLRDRFSDDCALNESISDDQHLKVYLRIKPAKKFPNRDDCYDVQSRKSFVTISREKKCQKESVKLKKIFNFSHIFDESNDSQLEVFERVIGNNVSKFVDGQDFTIMTYGASGSGKTYSLMGNEADPGIIPRFLESVFSHVTVDRLPAYKPTDKNTVEPLSSVQKQKEITTIQWIVKTCNTNLTNAGLITDSERSCCLESYRRMSTVLGKTNQICSSPKDRNTKKYNVWVSFAEIYNENIYDLLREDSNAPNHPPVGLKLFLTANSQPIIKGLRWVYARNGVEAFAALEKGKSRLRYAHTNVNKRSSRSHSIFFLKIVQCISGSKDTHISTFRLCDLAGSERAKKTGNEGVRLTESRNINKSLYYLERCLDSIHSQQSLPPYRESKLTSLLQNALSGKEAIAMLVNINPDPSFFDETQHVLQFSAIAKNIVRYVEPKHSMLRKSRSFSDIFENDQTSDLSTDHSLYAEIQDLKEELERTRKYYEDKLQSREGEIKQEMFSKYIKMNTQSNKVHEENLKRDMQRQAHVHQYEMKNLKDEMNNIVIDKEKTIKALTNENRILSKELKILKAKEKQNLNSPNLSKIHKPNLSEIDKFMWNSNNENISNIENDDTFTISKDKIYVESDTPKTIESTYTIKGSTVNNTFDISENINTFNTDEGNASLESNEEISASQTSIDETVKTDERKLSSEFIEENVSMKCNEEKVPLKLDEENLSLKCNSENVSLKCNKENVSLKSNDDNVSLTCNEKNVSLKNTEENVSFKNKEENISLKTIEENVSLKYNEENVSLKCNEENVSLKCSEENVSLTCKQENNVLQSNENKNTLNVKEENISLEYNKNNTILHITENMKTLNVNDENKNISSEPNEENIIQNNERNSSSDIDNENGNTITSEKNNTLKIKEINVPFIKIDDKQINTRSTDKSDESFNDSLESNQENIPIPINIDNFATAKKNNATNPLLNGLLSSVGGSKRKLFSRRKMDEIAAEDVEYLKSKSHLKFDEESPGAIHPEKVFTPYAVTKSVKRSCRKKKPIDYSKL